MAVCGECSAAIPRTPGSIAAMPAASTRVKPGTRFDDADRSNAASRSNSEDDTATTSLPRVSYANPRDAQYSRSSDLPRVHKAAFKLPGA